MANHHSNHLWFCKPILIYLWEMMYLVLVFNIIRYLILLHILSNFSECENARYLVSSFFLIYWSTLPKIIGKGFAPCGVFSGTSLVKYFHVIFYPIKYQEQN